MADKRRALGRGIDTLIPTELDRSILNDDQERIQKLLISDIVPAKDQPRQSWDDTALHELSTSVKQHGILQPIIVVKEGNGYRIVAGERRYRAAKLAGLKNLPAIVRSLAELEQVELALIENIQRVDLSPLDQALAVYKLQHQFSQSLDKIATRLGKAPSTISNLTRLLQLPETARRSLSEGKISEGHARAILALNKQPAKQTELLNCILNNAWTVRQAEQFVIKTQSTNQASTSRSGSSAVADDQKLVIAAGKKLGSKVRINRRKSGGQLVVDFANDEQLDVLIKKLTS